MSKLQETYYRATVDRTIGQLLGLDVYFFKDFIYLTEGLTEAFALFTRRGLKKKKRK